MFEYDTIEYYHDLLCQKIAEIWTGCKESGEDKRHPWIPYNLTRAKKIWTDFMKLGFVRDEKGLNKMAEDFVDKIATIEACTILGGHTQQDPKDYLESLEIEWDEDTEDKLGIYLLDEQGQWRLSDYALDKLQVLAGQILEAKTPEEKLLFLDMVLFVAHQRSDVASWFIKGGRDSLDELQNQ